MGACIGADIASRAVSRYRHDNGNTMTTPATATFYRDHLLLGTSARGDINADAPTIHVDAAATTAATVAGVQLPNYYYLILLPSTPPPHRRMGFGGLNAPPPRITYSPGGWREYKLPGLVPHFAVTHTSSKRRTFLHSPCSLCVPCGVPFSPAVFQFALGRSHDVHLHRTPGFLGWQHPIANLNGRT